MRSIVRGQKFKLTDLTPATQLQVGLAVSASSNMVLDISCFGVDASEKLSDDRYFIFYNQKTSPCGSLKSLGAQSGDQERFDLDLGRLPQNIRKLVFTVTIDSDGSMAQVKDGYLRIFETSNELARFSFQGSDFQAEKAVIVGEIYFKDVWRFSAVGQGFNGGLSALLKHFGGQEIAPAPAATATAAPAVMPPQRISLEKKLEKDAPQLVSLAKKLTVTLEKKKLQDVVARVALVLDDSGSMSGQYSGGKVQAVIDKVVPMAIHFDDDGELEVWAFANSSRRLKPVTVKNVKGYIQRERRGTFGLGYGNHEPSVIIDVISTFRESAIPAYVIFISDGGVGSSAEIEKLLIEASRLPIFWQFVGLGHANYGVLEHLDTLKGRTVDNCNFFALDDIDSVSDTELYDRLLNEFPKWLKAANSKGIVQGSSTPASSGQTRRHWWQR